MRSCYIYTRVSTEAQVDGYSLEAQQERLRQYAAYKDLEIANEYCDAGKSGHSIKGRPAFRQMMDDIVEQKDHISCVLVFKLSRFGRNAADVLKSMQTLSDFGIDLVCVEDAIDSATQGGRLTMAILSAVAEIERENINVQFMSGKLQKVKNGGWSGGPIPYGYQSIDRQLQIVPEEAEIVKEMFSLYLQPGATYISVTNVLNEKGYTKIYRGKERPFTSGAVKKMLGNPVYCGRFEYGMRSQEKLQDPNVQLLCVKGAHEPIVSEEVWEQVRKKRSKVTAPSKKTDAGERISILSGIVKCPVCGKGLVSVKSKSRNKIKGGYYQAHYSYGCVDYRKSNGRTCSFNTQYNQEKVDGAIYEMFQKITVHPVFQKEIADKMGGVYAVEEIDLELRHYRKLLRQAEVIQRRQSEKLDYLDILDEQYDEKYAAIEAELEALFEKIAQHEAKVEEISKRLEIAKKGDAAIRQSVDKIGEIQRYYEYMSREERREMYRMFIERIELYPKNDEGRILKSIRFCIPVYFESEKETSGSTPDDAIVLEIDCADEELTRAEAKPTYGKLKAYILEKHGLNVSTLYIAQMKKKYGLDLRECYNKPANPKARVPVCPREKEEVIVEAFKYFRLLDENVALAE